MPLDEEYNELDKHLAFLISDLHRLITSAVDKQMTELGLTRSQLRVLLHLLRKDGLSQVEIANNLEIGKSTVGGLIDRLIEKKLIIRKSDKNDARAKRIYLTAKFEKMQGELNLMGNVVMHSLLKDISKKEQELLVKNLLQIKSNTINFLNE